MQPRTHLLGHLCTYLPVIKYPLTDTAMSTVLNECSFSRPMSSIYLSAFLISNRTQIAESCNFSPFRQLLSNMITTNVLYAEIGEKGVGWRVSWTTTLNIGFMLIKNDLRTRFSNIPPTSSLITEKGKNNK